MKNALWFAGIFSAVLTAVLIAMIEDARVKLDNATMTNVRQDSDIRHNEKNIDDMDLRLKQLMEVAIGTNNSVIRIEGKLEQWEPTR